MHIRFFNTYDTAAPFFRSLVPFLAERGHRVDVVMSASEYRSGGDLSKSIGKVEGVEIKFAPSLGLQPNNRIAKVLVMLLYFTHTTLRTLFGPSVDQNVFLTQPPLIALLGYLLFLVRRQPYYCVVMDIYPQLMVALGLMSPDAIATKFLAKLATLALRNAEGVIVIGRCMLERVEKIGVDPERLHYIPNWADERSIYPVAPQDNKLRNDKGWQDKFVVLYAGNIGIPQHFDDILKVAEQTQESEGLLFVFIGDGSRKAEVKAQAEARGLNNVVMLPFLHDTYPLAEIISAGDVHLVPLKAVCTGLAVPSKAYSILSAGRPMIYQGSFDAEIARMIQEDDIGTVLACGDVAGLRQAILRYVNERGLSREQGVRALALARGPYSRQRALERYAKVLER